MIACLPSATLLGVDGRPVAVEVHVSNGLPGFTVVGLPDAPCRESRDRVRAALISSGLPWALKRVTVNLAPSGLRKGGSALDLPIAIGLLVAAGDIPSSRVEGMGFVGELGLDGSIRAVPGVLSLVEVIDAPTVVVPASAAAEAALVGRSRVRGVADLRTLVKVLQGERAWPPPAVASGPCPEPPGPDLADVRGQPLARWAVEVAAAGGHHLLLSGPPGAGKTMLATRLPGLLPPLDPLTALEATKIHSAAGLPLPAHGLVRRPPFRAPHHGASAVSLIGGGTAGMRPGEVSCAHGGVLFLDELGEFPAAVLDTLRQPLEEGVVRVSRARATVCYPARVLLVAAMNGCPCGDSGPACRCPAATRSRYRTRLSAPLLDRFDLRVGVERPDVVELLGGDGRDGGPEPTGVVARRVQDARDLARRRGVSANAGIPASRLAELAPLTPAASRILEIELRQGRLTGRGLHRIRRVARTVADLAGRDGPIVDEDVCTALALRTDPFPPPRDAW